MQLVIHSPFGARLNRAWGLALRKRFCRSFNFELQSAATDDANCSFARHATYSFPLDEVFPLLEQQNRPRNSDSSAARFTDVSDPLALERDARSLALPRQRGGKKIPAPLQRMESENLLAAVFPDQLACLENIAGDREVPDHPLVNQTIEDCLIEAMDIRGLENLLQKIERGKIQCIARDLPEPSPLASEILNARPYAFLDNAPLEERRTQAVYTRRASESSSQNGLGILDAAAIERVCEEAWPHATNVDELHETLLQLEVASDEDLNRGSSDSKNFLKSLANEKRAAKLDHPKFWVAAERLPMIQVIYPNRKIEPKISAPEFEAKKIWERENALRELVRGQEWKFSDRRQPNHLRNFFNCRFPKSSRRCSRWKPKDLFCAENFARTRPKPNGATAACSRGFTGSRSTGCARKSSRFPSPTFSDSYWRGSMSRRKTKWKRSPASKRFCVCLTATNCRRRLGNRRFWRHA